MSPRMHRHISLEERFERQYEPEPNSGCWLWIGAEGPGGYGTIGVDGRNRRAHRVAYELYVGPVDAETLDHLCRNRACVNPAHLEPVSNKENVLRGVGLTAINARKTVCKRGHPLEGDNIYWRPLGRNCRACRVIEHLASGQKRVLRNQARREAMQAAG